MARNLVDAGKPEEGPHVVGFLRSRGVELLDGIVVSNPDADHVGGFLDVLKAYQVSTVYLSGDTKGTSTFNAFLRVVRDEGSRVEEVRANLAAAFAAGLAPDSDEALAAAEAHRQHITRWFYDCSYDIHRGLTDMYVNDDRFRAHYDALAPGLAQFIREAAHANRASADY